MFEIVKCKSKHGASASAALALFNSSSGPSCSKVTTSLVNVSLNFQKLFSQICQYFFLKKCQKLLQAKASLNI